MRIATCSKLITALIAALSLASLGTTLLHSHLVQERNHSQRLLFEAHAATDLFAAGSDQLTDAVRTYAVTGDETYRRAFLRELDTFRTREQARERLLGLGATADELALIDQAKRHSDALLETERQSFADMAQGNRAEALALVYGSEYSQAKAAIRAALDQAREQLDARLRSRVESLSARARMADVLALGLLGSNVLAVLGALLVFYRRRLIDPITSMTAKLHRLLATDGNGVRFDEGAPGSEIADLAQALEESRQAGLAIRAQAAQLEAQSRELAASRERLHQTEAWYRGIIESAPDAVVVADDRGIVRVANLKLESLLGYGHGELLGLPLDSLIPGLQEALAELRGHAETPLPALLLPGQRRDGAQFPLEATLALLPARDGQGTSLCAVLRDISERQRAEGEMQRARELAEQAARAKSDFLANMSHEVRTPLNTIIGMAHLCGKTVLSGPQGDYLRQIQQAGEQLRAVVDDILDFSRIEDGELELQNSAFAVQGLLDEITQRFAERAGAKGLHFACSAATGLPASLEGDAQRIAQILAQFVDNAIKFTAAGEVEVILGGHRLSASQFELNVFVHDTGIGMTEEQQAALFGAFYQADSSSTRQYNGTGLGLALSSRLAGLMGGSIGVESRHGQGSTFWLSAPLGIATRQPKPQPRPDLHGCRVLLAEDHEVNQRLLRKLLEHAGVQVEVVENGQEAVERVREHDYDLVLMDMQMPVLDGGSATLAIRQLGARGQLPIIAISASAMPEDRRHCFKVGMNGFLAKPITVDELYATLGQWYRRQPAHPPAASPPPPAGSQELPEVAGLDTHAGLQRVLGDRCLYVELLRSLLNRERATPHAIGVALEQGDRESAERLAHTLKGQAATVGAAVVAQHAATLEALLRENAPASVVNPALERLAQHLEPLLGALEVALEAAPAAIAPALAPEQLETIRARLETLLHEDDAEAVTCFNEHAAALRAALADDYPRLEHAIRRFEFATALAILQPRHPLQPSTTHEPNSA
ncbi:response regulator [Pseudomonas sp. AN-1]|uniref:response regulator n=1 Tax=Pseudomonas sp. AN-1 TaxID=3096605 RepID=UPI002A6AA436|nr:response regulator [Pseudomonas sp. AN-1]WPP46267.1 response regulator [Pseudomonas sp. AN-1]